MRVPLTWLRELVEWPGDTAALAEALTARGLAVEAVERPAAAAQGLLVAEVVDVMPHPAADRLRVCRVRAGAHGATVVSGAPNLRPGMRTVWAPPGARLPDGRPVAVAELRGVASEGVLCAPDEADLPGGHEGVCELRPGDTDPAAPEAWPAPGAELAAVLPGWRDEVLVLELTANYAAHCQSVLGVAREVAALTGGALRPPWAARAAAQAGAADPAESPAPADAAVGGVREPATGMRPAAGAARVRVEVPERCPRYVAQVVEALSGAAAPLWMRLRLERAGMRPVSGVVDVTNYVMLELGQPLHAFDLDRLAGAEVVVRAARPGEAVVTLDGRSRALAAEDVVIADAAGPVAVAGVMGAQRAEVVPDTRRVLLESATFAAEAVARTARRLGLVSEAAARFSRGTDPAMPPRAMARAVALMASWLGGRPAGDPVDIGRTFVPRSVTLRGARARELLGVPISTASCGHHLERFGFEVRADGPDRLRVAVPSWRPDVAIEEDLVEEVARAYGYDRLPAVLPAAAAPPERPDPAARVGAVARTTALAAGFAEVQPYSFHGRELWERMRLGPDHPWRQAVELENPMSVDQACLRTTLAAGLLATLELNARRLRADVAVFEVGRFFRARQGERPLEVLAFGAAAVGELRAAGWGWPAEPADFFALKGLCEEILERAGLERPRVRWTARPEAYPTLHPGRSAEVRDDGGRVLGWIGELHPEVSEAFSLRGRPVLAELDLAAVAAAARPPSGVRPLPQHPPVRRDLALFAPADLPAAEVERAIRALAGPLLAGCRLFDVFQGAGVPAGCRSLAYALTYQDPARTLTDAEVDAAHDAVRLGLVQRFAVTLRS